MRDAAGVDDRDVSVVGLLDVTVGEQSLTDLLRVRLRDLAAEKPDRERRHERAMLMPSVQIGGPAVGRPPPGMPEARELGSLRLQVPGRDHGLGTEPRSELLD